MGLDTVELVMAFEEEFQISIPDREAELIQTIGQTVDYVYERLRKRLAARDQIACWTQHAFYSLRAGLVRDMKVARRSVVPTGTIGSLLKERWQRRSWPRFARQHGLAAPRFSWSTAERFPRPDLSIGTLANEIVSRDWMNGLDSGTEQCKQAILDRVRKIVTEQLGVDHSRVQLETHYIDDLNAG